MNLFKKYFIKAAWFLHHLVWNPKMAVRRFVGYFRPPLLSFQMGKVGSQSIKSTIETDYLIHHMHTRQEMELLLPLLRRKSGKKLDLITATREPVGREISVFFQNLIAPDFPYGVSTKKEAFEIGVEGLIPLFREMYDSGGSETISWFDRHFKPSTGVDVYDHPFDKQKGWDIIETDGWRILIVRFEDISRNYLDAVNSFAAPRHNGRLKYKRMREANVSENKWYAPLMREFKTRITFKQEILDSAFQSRYCTHFYTPAEIERMNSRYKVGSK